MARYRILHVEDNDEDALLVDRKVTSALGRTQVVVMRVETALEAERYLARASADLLMIDLDLPDAFSLDEVIVRMRHLSDAPVVVVSGAAAHALSCGVISCQVALHLEKSELGCTHTLEKRLRPLLEASDASLQGAA